MNEWMNYGGECRTAPATPGSVNLLRNVDIKGGQQPRKIFRIHKLDTFQEILEVTRARTTEFTHMSAAQPSLCQTKPQDCKSALSIQWHVLSKGPLVTQMPVLRSFVLRSICFFSDMIRMEAGFHPNLIIKLKNCAILFNKFHLGGLPSSNLSS